MISVHMDLRTPFKDFFPLCSLSIQLATIESPGLNMSC